MDIKVFSGVLSFQPVRQRAAVVAWREAFPSADLRWRLFLSTSCNYKTIKHLGVDSQFITSPLFFLPLSSPSSHTAARTYESVEITVFHQ